MKPERRPPNGEQARSTSSSWRANTAGHSSPTSRARDVDCTMSVTITMLSRTGLTTPPHIHERQSGPPIDVKASVVRWTTDIWLPHRGLTVAPAGRRPAPHRAPPRSRTRPPDTSGHRRVRLPRSGARGEVAGSQEVAGHPAGQGDVRPPTPRQPKPAGEGPGLQESPLTVSFTHLSRLPWLRPRGSPLCHGQAGSLAAERLLTRCHPQASSRSGSIDGTPKRRCGDLPRKGAYPAFGGAGGFQARPGRGIRVGAAARFLREAIYAAALDLRSPYVAGFLPRSTGQIRRWPAPNASFPSEGKPALYTTPGPPRGS